MFTEIITSAQQIAAPAVNALTRVDLIRAVRTFGVQLRLRLTNTLAAGPATVINNGGTPWSVFSRVGLDENGARNVDIDPRLAILWTQMFFPRDPDVGRVRQTNLANGAYVLEESIFLPFSGSPIAGPAESIFMERDVRRSLSAFVNQDTASGVGRIVQTPGTSVISAATIGVSQRYDVERAKRTVLLPVVRQVEVPVVAASGEFTFKIDSTRYLQGIIIQQDTTGAGEVADIINSIALRADGRDLFGPGLINYEEMQAWAQQDFAADVVPRGALPLWFRKGGRLSNILNPNSMSNLRLVANVQPSVTVGATNSVIRLLLLELERVEGLTIASVPYQI